MFYSLLLITVLISGCKKTQVQKVEEASSVLSTSKLATEFNPWGVLITSSASSPFGIVGAVQQELTNDSKISLAHEYGVKYIRTNVTFDDWTENRTAFLSRYDRFTDDGFYMLLNIIWHDATVSGGMLVPAAFPNNGNNPNSAYYKFVKAVVDSLTSQGHTPPTVVVVENEETNKTFHELDDENDYQKYILMLQGVMNICHPKGIKVANGGITLRALTYATWDWLKNVKGRTVEAQTFAYNSMPPSSYYTLYKPKPENIEYAGLEGINSQIAMVKYYVENYKTLSLDYINFHWYEPAIARGWLDALNDGSAWSNGVSKNDTSAGALGSVVQYLTMATGNKKVISNEIGQLTQSDCLTRKIMKKIASRPYNSFAIACWYDGDGEEEYDGRALHNSFLFSPFYNVRTTGTTFQKLIKNPDGFPSCSPLQ